MRFEWDEAKNRANVRKHGVDFELAIEVFSDPDRVDEFNRDVDGEERRQVVGMAGSTLLILFVVYTERNHGNRNEETIRIISARKAGRKDRGRYSRLS